MSKKRGALPLKSVERFHRSSSSLQGIVQTSLASAPAASVGSPFSLFLDLKEVELRGKCLETTDGPRIAAARDLHQKNRGGLAPKLVSIHGRAGDGRRRQRETDRADIVQDATVVIAIPGGRVVACRGAKSSRLNN